MESTYLQSEFRSRIDRQSIRTIVECGSRDCLDALALKTFYSPEQVFAFECNPESIVVCEANLVPGITLVPKAVSNYTGVADFYATDMDLSKDKNIGASSLLVHCELGTKEYIQKKIQVECIRLDEFMASENIDTIDLLCMDLQGAEPLALEGLGERIKDVRYIIAETSKRHFYQGDMLVNDFTNLLNKKGFMLVVAKDDDALYQRK